MPSASLSIDIEAPAELVMAVITDFRSYPQFLGEMRAVEVLRDQPPAWEVRFTVDVVRPLVYTLRLVQVDDLRLDWSLVEGAFRANDGSWVLEPQAGGEHTRATYRLDIQTGVFIPGSILRSLVDGSMPRTVGEFKQECERRARAGSVPPAR